MTRAAPQEEGSAGSGKLDRADGAHELAHVKAELQRTRALADSLLSHLSHELRMPMTVIIGSSQLLLESELDPVERDVLGAVQDAGKSLFAMVTDVFDFARFDSGALSLARRDFDLGSALRDTCDAVRAKGGHDAAPLTLTLDASVPRYARGDGPRLRQILSHLLGASLRAAKGTPIDLRVSARAFGDDLELSCLLGDPGHDFGSPPSHELSSASALLARRPFAGTGLGLVLAVKLVELMRGHVQVYGRPGAGSAYRVTLRLEQATSEAEVASAPPLFRTPSTIPDWDTTRHSVLVAEDDTLNRIIVARALETLGCETSFASSGAEAVDALRQRSYDAVLMDCEMPELDGFEATARIRKLSGAASRVPIIALTANAAPGDRERCLSAGMNDYLAKPFSLADLRAKLVLHLSGDAMRIIVPEPMLAALAEPPINATREDPVDRSRLDEIGSPELVHELTQIFLDDMAVRLQALSEAHRGGDGVLLERGAHAVKGACGNFGARRMAALAETIEHDPQCNEATADAIAGLHAEFARVRAVLVKERSAGAQEGALPANSSVPAPSRAL